MALALTVFDLVVIGSGPAGEKAAVKGAYHGKRVALVAKESKVGGAASLDSASCGNYLLISVLEVWDAVMHKGFVMRGFIFAVLSGWRLNKKVARVDWHW